MNRFQFPDGPRWANPYDVHPSDKYAAATAPTTTALKAADPVDWPETRELRSLLQCGDINCRCQREGGSVHCPAPEDIVANLSVDEAPKPSESGPQSLWFCDVGCSQEVVARALHERVFGGSGPTTAATAATAATPTNGDVASATAPEAFKTKRLQTRRKRGANAASTLKRAATSKSSPTPVSAWATRFSIQTASKAINASKARFPSNPNTATSKQVKPQA